MGNDNSRSYPNNHFNIQDWVQLPADHDDDNDNQHGNFKTYQHKVTQQQIDKYDLAFISQQDGDNYYQCFLQRLRQDHIVNTVEFKKLYVKQFCSTTYLAQVYIQHIPVRLSYITDIPFPQNIYILRCCLMGFNQLYKSLGYFQVRDDHICIDKYGIVRVWMNSDLSKNYPQEQRFLQVISESQSTMVKRIIQIIQNNTDKGQQPITIQQFFDRANKKFPVFQQALSLLDWYIDEYKIVVPDYCESILQIFQQNLDQKMTQKEVEVAKQNSQNQNLYNHLQNFHIQNQQHQNRKANSFNNTYNGLGVHPNENPSSKFVQILPNNINQVNYPPQYIQNPNPRQISHNRLVQKKVFHRPAQQKIIHNEPAQINFPHFNPKLMKNSMKVNSNICPIKIQRPHSNIARPNNIKPNINFNYKPVRPISQQNHYNHNVNFRQKHQIVNIPHKIQRPRIQQKNIFQNKKSLSPKHKVFQMKSLFTSKMSIYETKNQLLTKQNQLQRNIHQHRQLSENEKKIVQNVLTSLNIQLPEYHLKDTEGSIWSYNVTGDSTQELDPQIAKDLLKYL